MGDVTPIRRLIDWAKMRQDEAEQIIRARAGPENTGQVIFSDHTWDRVDVREITSADIFHILRTGYCHGQPKKNERDDWQVIISKKLAGSREAGVVTIILEDEEKLVIRTVEWMDER